MSIYVIPVCLAYSGVQHILCCVCLAYSGVQHILCCVCLAYSGVQHMLCCVCLTYSGVQHILCCVCLAYSDVQHMLCCVFLRLVYPILPGSLDCPFFIAPLVFSNVYLVDKRCFWKKNPSSNTLID
jgi:hypothetical protein